MHGHGQLTQHLASALDPAGLLVCNDDICRSQYACLARPSLAMAPAPYCTTTALYTKNGIPQGDPLSFVVALAPHLHDLNQTGLFGPLGFADDVMLCDCAGLGSPCPLVMSHGTHRTTDHLPFDSPGLSISSLPPGGPLPPAGLPGASLQPHLALGSAGHAAP